MYLYFAYLVEPCACTVYTHQVRMSLHLALHGAVYTTRPGVGSVPVYLYLAYLVEACTCTLTKSGCLSRILFKISKSQDNAFIELQPTLCQINLLAIWVPSGCPWLSFDNLYWQSLSDVDCSCSFVQAQQSAWPHCIIIIPEVGGAIIVQLDQAHFIDLACWIN